jgi:hypothetical protein
MTRLAVDRSSPSSDIEPRMSRPSYLRTSYRSMSAGKSIVVSSSRTRQGGGAKTMFISLSVSMTEFQMNFYHRYNENYQGGCNRQGALETAEPRHG